MSNLNRLEKSNLYGSISSSTDYSDSEIGFHEDDDDHNNFLLDKVTENNYIHGLSTKSYLLPTIVIVFISSMLIAFSFHSSSSNGNDNNHNYHNLFQSSLSNMMTSSLKVKDSSETKPNFVILLADDLAWNSIGYVDKSLEYVTPTLTKFARKGIIMENFYAQEVCTPSRAALLTGKYPLTVGMQYGMVAAIAEWGLPLEETILPEILKQENYTTHLLGKWHLGHYSSDYLPTARGFDTFTGYLNGENYYWSKRSPDYDDYVDFMEANSTCYRQYQDGDKHDYSTVLYTNKALDIIDNHPMDKSMFLFMSYQAVHDPFVDFNQEQYLTGIPDSYMVPDVLNTINSTILGFRRQQYMKSLSILDQSVKKIEAKLSTKGMMNNTYIIFISDNGGCVYGGGKNGPLRGSKGALFEGGVKVNSFIYSPLLKQSAGTIYKGLMHISDWFPTMLSLAGINIQSAVTSSASSITSSLDGVDHSMAWFSYQSDHGEQQSSPRKSMLYNMYTALTDFHTDIWKDGSFAIRDERYKLMHTYDDKIYGATYDPSESIDIDDDTQDVDSRCAQQFVTGNFKYWLFDLQNDPYEQVNLYDSNSTDHIDAKQRLYDMLPAITAKAKTKISIKWSDTALDVWKSHDNFVVPWSLNATSDSPQYCLR